MSKYIDVYKAEEVLARQTWLNNIDLITAMGALKLLVPAADVQEVKHGRWNELPYAYECSVCGILRAKGIIGKYNYCPNCGASMMDEVEE